MSEIPDTSVMTKRPVWLRHLRRLEGHDLPPPSEEEKQDAIAVLRDAATWERLDLIFERAATDFKINYLGKDRLSNITTNLVAEAERIHAEASETL